VTNGNWKGAISEYREAIRLDPKQAAGHTGLAVALHHNGDVTGAIREMQEAINLEPGEGSSHSLLADWLEQRGDNRGAVLELREALRLGRPNYVTDAASWEAGMHSRIAEALEKQGSTIEAAKEYGIACDQESDMKIRNWYCAAHKRLSGDH
jgi:eukaryotic-like serine/threonine-protein kinase